jgi:hypothetical protein
MSISSSRGRERELKARVYDPSSKQ